MQATSSIDFADAGAAVIKLLKQRTHSLLAQAGKPLHHVDHYRALASVVENELHKVEQLDRRDGVIRAWHDREIGAGEDWKGAIDEHLNGANIIVLLVSSDFLASDYCYDVCYDVEMTRALERHRQGHARIIPVILRACDWQKAPFATFKELPNNGKPITTWSDQDDALLNVAQGIREVAEEIRTAYG